jgi:hypothetical protein
MGGVSAKFQLYQHHNMAMTAAKNGSAEPRPGGNG